MAKDANNRPKSKVRALYLGGTFLLLAWILYIYWTTPVRSYALWGRSFYSFVAGVAIVNVYLLLVLLHCAKLSNFGGGRALIRKITPLPKHFSSLFQLVFIIGIVVISFAGMYREYDHSNAQDSTKWTFQNMDDKSASKVEAIYFSAVTLTSLSLAYSWKNTTIPAILGMRNATAEK